MANRNSSPLITEKMQFNVIGFDSQQWRHTAIIRISKILIFGFKLHKSKEIFNCHTKIKNQPPCSAIPINRRSFKFEGLTSAFRSVSFSYIELWLGELRHLTRNNLLCLIQKAASKLGVHYAPDEIFLLLTTTSHSSEMIMIGAVINYFFLLTLVISNADKSPGICNQLYKILHEITKM